MIQERKRFVFSEAEDRKLYVFRELLKAINHLERSKDPHDMKAQQDITAGKEDAFETYRRDFYPDPRLR